jgi:hypothetical protein
MYRGFNLETVLNQETIDKFYQSGKRLFDNNKAHVEQTLSSFIDTDNSLDGSSIQKTWFPQINSDIFISHSRDDTNMAIALAGWLWERFKLKTFIDSCIWGYSNDLLRLIDNKYCWQPNGTYNYNKRNYSTSHVHMMLSTALSMMIDKTECIFFLNTPSSVRPADGIQKTKSPWIYSEIVTTQMVRENMPLRLKKLTESWLGADGDRELIKGETKTFSITHDIDLKHLTEINYDDLINWQNKYSTGNALDKLYELKPPATIPIKR